MFGQQRCKYTQPNLSSSAPETTAQEHESFQKLPNRNRRTEALSLTPTHGRHIFNQGGEKPVQNFLQMGRVVVAQGTD